MSKHKIQTQAEHYLTCRYNTPARMSAYGYQIKETMECSPNNVLEIGLGNGIVSLILKKFGFSVTTLDHNKKLCPDIVASVTNIPLDDGSFDVVLCCEVLEHIPYSDFEKALREIYRVTRKHLIITLPDKNRYFSITAKIPMMRERRLVIECPFLFPKKHKYDGEHYWEIGKKGYSLGRICKSINNSGFTITSTYRMREILWHRMFVAHKSQIR